MMPGPTMIMLPVADRATSERFYRDVFGWTAQPIGPNASRLDTGGAPEIVLIDRDYLATESGIARGAASLSLVAAIALSDRVAVDALAERATANDAIVTSGARVRDFGIYSLYLTDPDGSGWEILAYPTG